MKNLTLILSIFLLFLGFEIPGTMAQDFPPQISGMEIHQESSCDDSRLEVSFDIRHGYDWALIIPYNFVRFTPNSILTATLHRKDMEPIALGSFHPSQVPGDFSTRSIRIRNTFELPTDLPIEGGYRLAISSERPTAGPEFSEEFQINTPPPIRNNQVSLKEPESGTIWGMASRGDVLRLEAPEGTVFTEVLFASFGDPSGSEGEYQQGFCHYQETMQTIESLVIGKRVVEIPVGAPRFPSEFGLLCEILNLFNMRLAVTLRYEEVPQDSGGTILGTTPEGGNGSFTYRWERSTMGPNSGFEPAPGVNNQKDYQYGDLAATTWFRRVVYSGRCQSISNLLEIKLERNTWTGKIDEDWNNAGNWSQRKIPDLQSAVSIPKETSNQPVIGQGPNAKVLQLHVEEGASVSIENNWLQIAGSLVVDGSLDATQGSVAFFGERPQEIPAGSFVNNEVENLLVENIGGVHSLGELEVSGVLKVESGSLHTADALTLRSTKEGTAMIDGSGNGSIEGMVKVQRYLEKAFGYHYISAPVEDLQVGDFVKYFDLEHSVTGFPHFYRYEESRTTDLGQDATGWEPYTDPQAPLEVMRGYAINLGEEEGPLVLELEGRVHDGVYSKTLENHQGLFTKGFHLVGNPYFSPIDWDSELGWEKINIDDAIYFFVASEHDPYSGTYTSYVNKISSRVDHEGPLASSIIPSMQGFFVHVNEGNGEEVVQGKLSMSNVVRSTGQRFQFFKMARDQSPPLMRLSAGKQGEDQEDPLVIYFEEAASSQFEKRLDALKLMNTDFKVPNFYSLTPDGKHLSINAQPLKTSDKLQKIPLGLEVKESGIYSIHLDAAEGLPTGMMFYLVDLERKISHDLKENPTFTFRASQGKEHGRFELQLSTDRPISSAEVFNELFSVQAVSGNVVVHLNLEEDVQGQVYLSNISGQVLEKVRAKGKEQVQFTRIPLSGVYLVTLEVGGSKQTKKVLIKK